MSAHLSNGSDFETSIWVRNLGGFNSNQHWLSGDFNGGGIEEVAKIWANGNSSNINVYIKR
ncbi:hypothetical protein [Wenyingzhuangia sp. IMCC45574]